MVPFDEFRDGERFSLMPKVIREDRAEPPPGSCSLSREYCYLPQRGGRQRCLRPVDIWAQRNKDYKSGKEERLPSVESGCGQSYTHVSLE